MTCLFWVVLLVGSYGFGRWICRESDYSCDAACSRDFHYNLPAETTYFHHGARPSASELSNEINRIRAREHERRMRLKRKQANEREFRCSSWGGCTKQWWDEVVKGAKKKKMMMK